MSSDSTRLFLSDSGTSPLTMRCARPSTIAVLPTPGSPISTGLFLVRRCSTWIARRISSSRPITGSSLPCARALGEVERVFLRAPRAGLRPRRSSHALAAAHRLDRLLERLARQRRARLREPPGVALVVGEREQEHLADAMNWSPRFCASLSVRLSRLFRSREMLISPPRALDLGQAVDRLLERPCLQRAAP